VRELEGAGFLDDARFAQRFAEDKRSIERWGSERIERELRRRGVAPDLIEVVAAPRGAGDEMQAALSLLAERVAPPESDRERDRAWRLLVRKGYGPELAYEAIRVHGRDSL
jgi:regulatory protein